MATVGSDSQLYIKNLIGEGAFGKVFLLENKKGEKFALKEVSLNRQNFNNSLKEVEILSKLQHPHILTFVSSSVSISVQGYCLLILTEFCEHGDLGKFVATYKGQFMMEWNVLMWIRQISDALQYLHGMNPKIIHRDLKSNNVLLDKDWNAKLGDFGISRILDSPTSMAQTWCGTLMYMSPEVLEGKEYNEKSDIYSLGIIMYEMCNMHQYIDYQPLENSKRDPRIVLPMPLGYQKFVTDLLLHMINFYPSSRPSAGQIMTYLNTWIHYSTMINAFLQFSI